MRYYGDDDRFYHSNSTPLSTVLLVSLLVVTALVLGAYFATVQQQLNNRLVKVETAQSKWSTAAIDARLTAHIAEFRSYQTTVDNDLMRLQEQADRQDTRIVKLERESFAWIVNDSKEMRQRILTLQQWRWALPESISLPGNK